MKLFNVLWISLAMWGINATAKDVFEQCPSLAGAAAAPKGAKTCREAYSVGHDERTGSLRWVHYTLNPVNAYVSEMIYPLAGFFDQPSVPDTDGVYDMAPMVPRSLHAYDPTVFEQAMDPLIELPMHKHLHRKMEFDGEWAQMSHWESFYALRRLGTEVYAGPLFKNSDDKPSHFFKVYYDKNIPAMLAMILPNDGQLTDKRLAPHVVTVDCVEKQTGLDFFKGVPHEKDLENDRALTVRHWTMIDGNTSRTKCTL